MNQFPLNESQERRLTITLASLERNLEALRRAVGRPSPNLRLTRYEDPIPKDGADPLLEGITRAKEKLREMADTLGLEPRTESLRRMHLARLELAMVELREVYPGGAMRGYGEMSAATAAYLETTLPELEATVRQVVTLLAGRTGCRG